MRRESPPPDTLASPSSPSLQLGARDPFGSPALGGARAQPEARLGREWAWAGGSSPSAEWRHSGLKSIAFFSVPRLSREERNG